MSFCLNDSSRTSGRRRPKFYVYSGYISPDNYDASEEEIYSLKEFETLEEVRDFKEEFLKNIHEKCQNIVFKVIEGGLNEKI